MNEQSLNILFVREIEKRPVLYDFKLPEYSRKDITEKAWSEVGKTVNMTVAECKERWRNLRTVFVRHIKPPRSGARSKNKKRYYLSEAMQFTIPFIKSLSMATGNLHGAEEEEDIKGLASLQELIEIQKLCRRKKPFATMTASSVMNFPELTEKYFKIFTDQEHCLPSDNTKNWRGGHLPMLTLLDPFGDREESVVQESTSLPIDNEPPPTFSTLPTTLQHPTPGIEESPTERLIRPMTAPCKRKTDPVDNIIIEYFQTKNKKIQSTSNTKSEALRMFLLSLLPDLESMTDQGIRQFKRKTLQTIEEILSLQHSHSNTFSTSTPSPFSSSTFQTEHSFQTQYSTNDSRSATPINHESKYCSEPVDGCTDN